ncbi:MAG: flagellar motor switch protein FliN [Enterocloster clostridioformis]|uniref:flagellar motor switch protein FliN n=1 Tax=Enterocloster clostridioformis TaxID=1531 RepID=UPI00242CEB60|nr:flagellar motor switch protein FliN [Enterocloster clostridioformis]MCI6125271.1 flagellar motor switch protein FliN [Enterocloster clostridioformis]MDY4762700.1 flagellar motor switch protein FliN [Enterocloster clostridioformis]
MGASSFNEMEIDAIGEIMNISLGASATAVSTMLGTTVNITTPVVKVLGGHEFEFKKLEPAVGVEISYVEGLEGSNVMMFSRNDVRIIVGMLMGCEIPDEEFELDEINRSAICEVMNQMMGSSATALSEFLGVAVNISTPISFEIEDETSFRKKYFPTEANKVVVRFSLEVEGKLKSEFLNIMSVELAKRLLEPFASTFGQMEETAEGMEPKPQESKPQEPTQPEEKLSQEEIQRMMQKSQEPSQPEAKLSQEEIQRMMQESQEPLRPEPKLAQEEIHRTVQEQPAPVRQPAQPQPIYNTVPQPVYQAAPDPMMLQLLNQMQQSQMQMMEMMHDMKTREKARSSEPSVIRPINPSSLGEGAKEGVEEHANREMLMKVPLEISVEIGRTKKLVKDILEFTQGSLVVLDKMAGEQADLYVNGQCIGRGDIVVVEDNFGIRITEIVARNLNPESL